MSIAGRAVAMFDGETPFKEPEPSMGDINLLKWAFLEKANVGDNLSLSVRLSVKSKNLSENRKFITVEFEDIIPQSKEEKEEKNGIVPRR